MKKAFSFLAIIGSLVLLPFSSASANHNGRLVGYTDCGIPVYATHEIVGHDHCGRNVWEWVTHYPRSCHCHDRYREPEYCRPSGHNYEAPYRGSSYSFSLRF